MLAIKSRNILFLFLTLNGEDAANSTKYCNNNNGIVNDGCESEVKSENR